MSYDQPLQSAADGFGRRTIFRYSWLLAPAVLLGAPLAYVVWTGVDVTYTAQGTLWIATPAAPDARHEPIAPPPDGFAWIELLRSYRVLESVVIEHRLHVDVPRGSLEPDATRAFSVVTPRDAAEALSRDLTARADRNVLSVALSGSDPEKTANVLNALMEELVEVASGLQTRKLEETLIALDAQLAEVETELAGAEHDLEHFRVTTNRRPGNAVPGAVAEPSDGDWTMEEARLGRRVRAAAGLYAEVLGRVESARLARASATPDVRILDRASVPKRPSEDMRLPVTLAVLLGWLGVVGGGALLLGGREVRPAYGGVHGTVRRGPGQDVGPVLAILAGGALAVLMTLVMSS